MGQKDPVGRIAWCGIVVVDVAGAIAWWLGEMVAWRVDGDGYGKGFGTVCLSLGKTISQLLQL